MITKLLVYYQASGLHSRQKEVYISEVQAGSQRSLLSAQRLGKENQVTGFSNIYSSWNNIGWQDIMIYKKYIFGHSNVHGPASLLPKRLKYPEIRAVWVSFVIIFDLLSSVPEITSEPERWSGVLLSITSSFLQQLFYVSDATFGKLLRKGASWVGNQWWLVTDSRVSPTPWFLGREEGMRVEFVSNGQELSGCWTGTHHRGWCLPDSMVTEALKFESLPDLVLCISWSGCSFTTLNILSNKLVI